MQSEMKSSKSSVLAGVDGSVASDLISTLSFVTAKQPQIVTGELVFMGAAAGEMCIIVSLCPTLEINY